MLTLFFFEQIRFKVYFLINVHVSTRFITPSDLALAMTPASTSARAGAKEAISSMEAVGVGKIRRHVMYFSLRVCTYLCT